MRAAIIPAQIITVEDKIAGSLSLSQIVILMIPLIFAMSIYIIFPPVMKFSLYKVTISVFITCISLLLALRIKGKIVFQWIIVLLRYHLRPGYYLFNKNDATERMIAMPVNKKKIVVKKTKEQEGGIQKTRGTMITDLIRFDNLVTNPAITLRYRTNKKGGLTIAIDQIKK